MDRSCQQFLRQGKNYVPTLFLGAIRALHAAMRETWIHYVQRRHESATREALRRLDDLTLRDLGIRRAEVDSVAAEAAGTAECTRRRLRPRSASAAEKGTLSLR
jgi:uncharacterized protein YjiS (DUF1127 family)